MQPGVVPLVITAAVVALGHALLGPDHYVPFLALARARAWSLRRTLMVTVACGLAHVGSSILLAVALVAVGRSAMRWAAWEEASGAMTGWFLVAFGAAYAVWGFRHGVMGVHRPEQGETGNGASTWVIFLIFVFGPCEPLIPLAAVPAARHSWGALAAVSATFAAVTVITMAAVVGLALVGARRFLPSGVGGRWSHALAGAAVAACGVAVQVGL